MDFWTSRQITEFIGIEQAFEEFCGTDPELGKLDSTYPGLKSKKFKEWRNQYGPAHDAATERFVDLFRGTILVAWVLRDDKDDDDGVTLPLKYWGPSVASLTLTKGKVEGRLLDEQHKHLASSRVVLRKKDRGKWTNNATLDSQHGRQEAVEIAVPEESEDEPKTFRERAEGWLEDMEALRKTEEISWAEAARRVADSAGVDSATVEREARRIRLER